MSEWERRYDARANERMYRRFDAGKIPVRKAPEDRLPARVRARLAARTQARTQRRGRSR